MNLGCFLGLINTSILAFADDVIILSPSITALQLLLDIFVESIHELCIQINTSKSVYIMFKHKKQFNANKGVFIENKILNKVNSCKYLGFQFNDEMSITDEVERLYLTFLKQFNSIYHKFNFLDRETLVFLFKTFCTSFYGIELFYDNLLCVRRFNKLSVVYHKAIKRMAGLSPWSSNHHGCEICHLLIFRHLIASRLISYAFSVLNNYSRNFSIFKYFFKCESIMFEDCREIFHKVYQVKDVFNNDLQAIKSRIKYVQGQEEWSTYCL